MDTGEWKESDAETVVYFQKWVSALGHVAGLPDKNNATLTIYLGLVVDKCTDPACVNVGKPLKSRLRFTIKYVTF